MANSVDLIWPVCLPVFGRPKSVIEKSNDNQMEREKQK